MIKYNDINIEQAEKYNDYGYIVWCDGDGFIIKIEKESDEEERMNDNEK